MRKGPAKRLADPWQRTLTRELMTRPDLRILDAVNRNPADLEHEIETILKELKSEYRPGLAGEMRFPDVGRADQELLEWKKSFLENL